MTIYYRNKRINGDSWNSWRYCDCAEYAMTHIYQDRRHTQVLPYLTVENIEERMVKALEVLEKYNIEGAEIIPEFNVRGIESPVLEVVGLPCFKPLVHALIRAVRDNQEFKWAILEGVASAVSQRKDQVWESNPKISGSISWLSYWVHPELWVPAFSEVCKEFSGYYPMLYTAVAAFTGKMEEIHDGHLRHITGVLAPPRKYSSPYDALRYTTYEDPKCPSSRPYVVSTKYGTVWWLPKEWFEEHINYRFK